MTLTHNSNSINTSPRVQTRNVQDTTWLTIEQEQEHDHDYPLPTLSQHSKVSQNKTEDEDTIEIHDSYFDGQDEEEDNDHYMKEDEDMLGSAAQMDEEAVTCNNPMPPPLLPPPRSPRPMPVISDTRTGSSFSIGGVGGGGGGAHGDTYHGRKRPWTDRRHEPNTKEREIFTKRYRTYNSNPPALDENRDNNHSSGGFKEQVEDLRQLINAVDVGSNASSCPHSIATSDLGSVHTTNTRNCSHRRRLSPEAINPSRPQPNRFTGCRHFAYSDDGEQRLSTGISDSRGEGDGEGGDNTVYTTTIIAPETLLQLALSELNCLITRHDEERAAHGQTKKGLAFVENRLMDAYKRIRVLSEDYEQVLQRRRRAERSWHLTTTYSNDHGRDDPDRDRDECSFELSRRRDYNRDMSRGRSRSRSGSKEQAHTPEQEHI
ncbi:hypothetical protein BGZ67_002194 [Mortierella alpina]|nr:hypothetical protein BGZ67_002194 [Mortierella alpina]